jgi:hypothetical protein
MSDRELLEAAARAAGIDLVPGIKPGYPLWIEGFGEWNPLDNDGDALRLAVKLRLDVHFEMNGPSGRTPIVEVMDGEEYQREGQAFCAMQDCSEDPYAATRRAIVRAAAAMATAPEKTL